MDYKVTILMTVYNDGTRLLKESIESILNQTYKNLEFVIVNDGSTDNSTKIIESYSKKDKRIKYINRMENKGRIYSLNEGVKETSGDFIFINDADDISYPKRVELCINYYKEQVKNKKNFGILGTASIVKDTKVKIENYKYINYGSISRKKIPMWRLYLGMPFVHSSFMYSRAALNKINGFSNELINTEDYFALIKIANKYDIYGLNKVLVQRTIDGNNYFLKNQKNEYREFNENIINDWKKKNIPLNGLYKIPKFMYEKGPWAKKSSAILH